MLQKLYYYYKKLSLFVRFYIFRSATSKYSYTYKYSYMMSFSTVVLLNLDKIFLLDNYTPSSIQKFIISLIGLLIMELWIFCSVIGYLFSLYIVNYTEIEKKFPKLKRILNYYKNSNVYFIIFEGLFFILGNIILILLFSHLIFISQT